MVSQVVSRILLRNGSSGDQNKLGQLKNFRSSFFFLENKTIFTMMKDIQCKAPFENFDAEFLHFQMLKRYTVLLFNKTSTWKMWMKPE